MWLSSSAQFKGRAHRACRGGAHNQLHRLERMLMPFAHFVDHGGPTLLVVQIMGRLANRCAVEDRPSGWRDPGQYRDGPCRHATTIETFRAGPNMNRRIAIVGDSLSDGGTVDAHVGPRFRSYRSLEQRHAGAFAPGLPAATMIGFPIYRIRKRFSFGK